MKHDTSGPGQRGFYDTSSGKEIRSSRRLMTECESSRGKDQGSDNAGNRPGDGHGRQEEHGQQEQGTLQGQRRHSSWWRLRKPSSNISHWHGGPKTEGLRFCREPGEIEHLRPDGKRESIFDIRPKGNMSPERGRQEIAL